MFLAGRRTATSPSGSRLVDQPRLEGFVVRRGKIVADTIYLFDTDELLRALGEQRVGPLGRRLERAAVYSPQDVGRPSRPARRLSRSSPAAPPMPEETIFSKIIRGEIPSDTLYQDDLVTAFRDIDPKRPTHVLIVPNRLIPTVDDVTDEDEAALGRLFTVARRIARDEGIAEDGYRLVVNCREHGRQEVMHLHMHLLGGADVGPMLVRAT